MDIGSAGLCRTDLHIIEGQWADRSGVALPYTLGHENAGWVREVGSAVEHLRPGDTVILHPLATAARQHMCRDGSRWTRPHRIQSLRAMTATRIVVCDPNEQALTLTKGWGAHETVLVDGRQVDRVLELTDGRGAEVVLDFVGEQGAELDSWRMTKRAGSHYVIGYGGTINVPAIDVISTERSVIGNLVGSYNELAELMALDASGHVHLLIRAYPLDAVQEAMDDLTNGRLRGRGILVPDRLA